MVDPRDARADVKADKARAKALRPWYGKFEFAVRGIECGQTRVGNQFLNKEAQGQFCVVSLNIRNIGNEAQTMVGDAQKLIDSQGREFSSDNEAAIYADQSKTCYADQSKTWFEQINPGNAVDGQLYFDVPRDAQPVRGKLHDSLFSRGVLVNLS